MENAYCSPYPSRRFIRLIRRKKAQYVCMLMPCAEGR